MNDVNGKISRMEDLSVYSSHLLSVAKGSRYFGRMSDPTSGANIKGPCGDEIELYLVIKDRIIEDIKFYTQGCMSTVICSHLTCELALGKSVDEVLGISAKDVFDKFYGLPKESGHCSILSVSALYRAIANYMFKK